MVQPQSSLDSFTHTYSQTLCVYLPARCSMKVCPVTVFLSWFCPILGDWRVKMWHMCRSNVMLGKSFSFLLTKLRVYRNQEIWSHLTNGFFLFTPEHYWLLATIESAKDDSVCSVVMCVVWSVAMLKEGREHMRVTPSSNASMNSLLSLFHGRDQTASKTEFIFLSRFFLSSKFVKDKELLTWKVLPPVTVVVERWCLNIYAALTHNILKQRCSTCHQYKRACADQSISKQPHVYSRQVFGFKMSFMSFSLSSFSKRALHFFDLHPHHFFESHSTLCHKSSQLS